MTSEIEFYAVRAQKKSKIVVRLLRIYLLVSVVVILNGFVLLGKNFKCMQTLILLLLWKTC